MRWKSTGNLSRNRYFNFMQPTEEDEFDWFDDSSDEEHPAESILPDPNYPFVSETVQLESVEPALMDRLWNTGWRHFGDFFFRYSFDFSPEYGPRHVMPIRINLAQFKPNKSLRRLARRNSDLDVRFAPATIDAEREEIFHEHKSRFKHRVPDSLSDFLSDQPAVVPCPCVECQVYDQQKLIAVSYLDLGETCASSVYAIFRPSYSSRRLGIYTISKEIEYARECGIEYLHLGYAYREPSHYDYKKQFSGMETFDWKGDWRSIPSS